MTDNTDKHNSETDVDESTPVEDPGAGGDNEASTKAEQEVEQASPPKNGIGGGGDAKLKDQDKHEKERQESQDEAAKQSSPKKVSLFEAPVVVEGKRDRKKTERLSDAIHKETLDKEKEILKQNQDIPAGSGTKFVDIPYINHMLTHKMKNEDLNLLHRLFFNTPGIKNLRRKHIKDFCGYSFEEGSSEYEKKLDFLTRVFKEDMRKYILLPLGIKQEQKKEETAKAVLDFCMKPEDRGVAIPLTQKQRKEAKKRKRSSSKKPKSSKSKKPKKDNKDGEDQEAGSGSDEDEDDDAAGDKDTEGSDNESDGDSPNVKTSDKEGDGDNEETEPKKVKKVSKKTEKTPKKAVKKEATPKSATKKKEQKTEKSETKKKTPKKKTDTKSPTPKKTKSPKKKKVPTATLR